MPEIAIALLIGLVVGGVASWVMGGRRITAALEKAALQAGPKLATLNERLAQREQEIESLKGETYKGELRISELLSQVMSATGEKEALTATLASERREWLEKSRLLEEAKKSLLDAFAALSAEALKKNNESFLHLARTSLEKYQEGAKADLEKREKNIGEVVRPVREALDKFDLHVRALESAREGAYKGLEEQVKILSDSQNYLRTETSNLVQALRSPVVRGRWGEFQLKRVVEMAGMLAYCDFVEQASVNTEDGRLRPDLIVKLPGGKTIIVDAKAPISGYLDAFSISEASERKNKLVDFSKLVRGHIVALSRKSYWDQFDATPEIVVMFLPGEHFLGAALEHDPSLIELGVEQKVLVATPTSLIGLLRAIGFGWRQEAISQNAAEISALGAELYKRLADMGSHFTDVGTHLQKSVGAYNRAVASLETRVFVTARKFKELETTSGASELKVVSPIESLPREPRMLENDRGDV